MCCSMSNCAGNRAGPRGVYSSLSSVCMRLMFGGSYGSCAQVFMQTLPVGRTGAARPAAGGPTCSSPRVRRRVLAAAGRWCPRWANWRAAGVKHGVAAAALAPAACCSDDRVAPIRASRPTETALTGLRPRIGMGAGRKAIHEPRRLSQTESEPNQPNSTRHHAEAHESAGSMADEYGDGMVYNISQRKNRDYMPG